MADKKKPFQAIALRYDQDKDAAPTVVAVGKGLIAEKIVDTAQEHGVAVEENAALAESLSQVELGDAIPEELYPVVAEVLVFVNRMNRKRGKEKSL